MTDRTDRIPVPQMAAPTVWLASPDGLVVIDAIAVEQAVNGHRSGWSLTNDEARFAASLMFDHGVPYSVVVKRVGVNAKTLKTWFPEVKPLSERMARPGTRLKEPAPCGTRRGYGAHKRRDEKPCKRCLAANSAGDRYYRLNGTYVGAPEVAA